jgi:hypothetical protein
VNGLERPLDVLLFAEDTYPANAVSDHIDALVHNSRHNWYVVNTLTKKQSACECPICRTRPPVLRSYVEHLDFDRFDALVLHWSIYTLWDHYLPPRVRAKITAFRGPKLQFLQDEYRWGDQISRRTAELGTHTLFTLVRPELVDRAYPDLRNVRKVTTLTGWVPENLVGRARLPIRERRNHIVYRGRQLPYWLGSLAQDKVRIAEGVQKLAAQNGLTFDISVREEDRIYGPGWIEFVGSAKSVLATESGSSIWDHDGRVQREVEAYLERHPNADFDTVAREVLAPYEGNLSYNAVSPRLFEAVALRTPMVMFPGWYNGVVEPDRHYIPLEKDFSNFVEVAAKLKDDVYLQGLADRAYDEIAGSGKFSDKAFAAQADQVLEETVRAVNVTPPPRRCASDVTRASLSRTTRVLRYVNELPLGEAFLPAIRRATSLLDGNTGSWAVRLAKAMAWVPLLPASLPLRIASIPVRAALRVSGRELAVARAAVRALLDGRQRTVRERVWAAARVGLNHYNNVLPSSLARVMRRAGESLRR